MYKKTIKKLIPANLHFRLVNLKHTFTHFKQIHYSQNGEDIILRSLFPRSYKGFYVDVGAHHPYRISNTYFLHQQGWNGINIDANSETIDMFNRARPNDINLNVGIANKSTEATYYKFSDPAVNTFSQAEAEVWKNKKFLDFTGTETIKLQPLHSILDKRLPDGKQIDVLNVDVEGLDFEVLKSNDWSKYKPAVIVIERHGFKIEDKENDEVYAFLKKHGYELSDKVKFSLIFKLID